MKPFSTRMSTQAIACMLLAVFLAAVIAPNDLKVKKVNGKDTVLLLLSLLDDHASHMHIVPHGPRTYRDESENQHANWKSVIENCVPVSPGSPLTPDCLTALNQYFMNEPVWDYSHVFNYEFLNGVAPYGLQEGIVNPRHSGSHKYGYDDYAMDQVPLGRDIFDGQLNRRTEVFQRIIADPFCIELSYSTDSGIREDKAEQCAAQEMYKYAAYLETCTTAFTRLYLLHGPGAGEFEHMSTYEAFANAIVEWVDDLEVRDLGITRLRKGYLHASWTARQCEQSDFALYSDEVSPTLYSWVSTSKPHENTELHDSIKRTYFEALRIAAKSGEEWAIRSYPLELTQDARFLSDVRERYPLLTHKMFGFESCGDLTERDRRIHQAKYYLLVEELAGPEVARFEFDASHLQEEIDHVQNGGELKYPDICLRWGSMDPVPSQNRESEVEYLRE